MKNLLSLIRPLNLLFLLLSGIILFVLLISLIQEIPSFTLIKGFIICMIFSFTCGGILYFMPHSQKRISYFDGCIFVVSSWLLVTLIGSLLYYLSLPISFVDSFFESMSGFTTTGATIFNEVETLPAAILLWRSTTQWLGGMGIIVLVVAVIPHLNFSNTSLNIYQAESPGPSVTKLEPTIQETAKFLWVFYLVLTLILFVIFLFTKMSWFDSLNHSFTTISTGGFSTKNNSIAYFDDNVIEIVMIFFMLFSSVNYSLHYNFLRTKSLKSYQDGECFFFFVVIFFIIGIIALFSFYLNNQNIFSFKDIIFTVVSLVTSSGFVITDYEMWLFSPQLLLVFLFLMGGCSGSTSGGIKVIRVQILAKYIYRELVRLVHPKIVMNIKINKKKLDEEIAAKTVSFLFIHFLIVAISIILISFETQDFFTACTGVLASIGNIGPAFGNLGPTETFATVGNFSKLVFSFNMLVGRLEIFTVVTLLIPSFWGHYTRV